MFLKRLDTGMLQSNCYILGIAGEADGGSKADAAGEAVGVDGSSDSVASGEAGSGEAVVIDPGVEVDVIAQILKANKLILKYIILTHAHIDHILYVGELQEACGGEVVIHEKDAPLLLDEVLNGSTMFGSYKIFKKADITVKDGDTLELGNDDALKSGSIRLEFIHTPGHSPGSMCIKATEIIPGAEVGDSVAEGVNSSVSIAGVKCGNSTAGDSCTEDGSSTVVDSSTVGDSCLFTGDTLFRRSVGRTDLGAGDSRQLTQSLRRLMELEDELTVYPGHGPHSDIGYEKKNNRYIAFAI